MYIHKHSILHYILDKYEIEGHVAQWIRARSYELQGRGFESLLAHSSYCKKAKLWIHNWGVAKW